MSVEETQKFRDFVGDIRDKLVEDLPGLIPACAEHLREKKIDMAYTVLQKYISLNENRADFVCWLTELIKEKNKSYAELCYDGLKAYLFGLPNRILANQSIVEQHKNASLVQYWDEAKSQQEKQSRETTTKTVQSISTYDPKRNRSDVRKGQANKPFTDNRLSSSASNFQFTNHNENKLAVSLGEEIDIRRQICQLQRQLLAMNLERIEEQCVKLDKERENILSEIEKLEAATDKMQI